MSMKSVLITLLMLLGFASQNAFAQEQKDVIEATGGISKCLMDDQEHAAVIPVSEPDSGDDYPIVTPTALALITTASEEYLASVDDILTRNQAAVSIRAPPYV